MSVHVISTRFVHRSFLNLDFVDVKTKCGPCFGLLDSCVLTCFFLNFHVQEIHFPLNVSPIEAETKTFGKFSVIFWYLLLVVKKRWGLLKIFDNQTPNLLSQSFSFFFNPWPNLCFCQNKLSTFSQPLADLHSPNCWFDI